MLVIAVGLGAVLLLIIAIRLGNESVEVDAVQLHGSGDYVSPLSPDNSRQPFAESPPPPPLAESPPPPPLASAPFDEAAAQQLQSAWAKHLKTEVEVTNSLGMKLMLIPPGEFQMGSPADEAEHSSDESQHHVRLTQPYYLGKFEVTQAEYEKVMGGNPSRFTGDARRPVETVSWHDAVEFCRRLSEREQKSYRLPTEAQWEYACRAGTTTAFHWGITSNGTESNVDGNYPYATMTKGTCLQRTTTVGNYAQNKFGVYDMHGNVWEWCHDGYDADYYSRSTAADPHGPADGLSRVLRGGSWNDYARLTRSANRYRTTPDDRNATSGFRISRTP